MVYLSFKIISSPLSPFIWLVGTRRGGLNMGVGPQIKSGASRVNVVIFTPETVPVVLRVRLIR